MRFHFCKIEIESKYIYRLLNNTKDIKLRNIIVGEDKTEFIVDYRDIDELRNILLESKIDILNLEEKDYMLN